MPPALPNDVQYDVTIAGTAFVRDPNTNNKTTKPYRCTITLNRQQVEAGPVSVFAKHFAPKILPKALPGYVNLETHELVQTVTSNGVPVRDTRLMNRLDMELYIAERGYDIYIDLYQDSDSLRQAIIDIESDPSGFQKNQDKIMGIRKESIDLSKSINLLNPQDEFDFSDPLNIRKKVKVELAPVEEAPEAKAPATGAASRKKPVAPPPVSAPEDIPAEPKQDAGLGI